MDILERLSEYNPPDMVNDEAREIAIDIQDAKNEIERLREALSAIAATEGVDKINPDADAKMMWIGCAQIARFALQQNGSE